MKPGILLLAKGSSEWIGGLYYIKSIAYQLVMNTEIAKRYNIYIFITDEGNYGIFESLSPSVRIVKSSLKGRIGEKICEMFFLKKNNIKFVFPTFFDWTCLGVHSVAWIADFQHNRLPENFQQDEIFKRTEQYMKTVNSKNPLILSSQDALKDYRQFYSQEKSNVFVVHFVSYIEPEIQAITSQDEDRVLQKFNLDGRKFVLISNQFWKHKNHILVLKSIKYLAENYPDLDLEFVFTGMPKDYRNTDYYDSVMKLFETDIIKRRSRILGFIERTEQLIIMKNASFVIQPSLFEGWGTTVEDAKVLDKQILLSDIPIHREQMNENCSLFDPFEPESLAKKILEVLETEHKDEIQKGIARMQEEAIRYSEELLKMINIYSIDGGDFI